MKIIAFYLPQFHEIPENNEMWGEGFTEWSNVKKGTPLFEGHEQPVVPLNNNYYNLLNPEVMKWQIDLARKYGIYGFCFYHYWYNGHKLMNKPIDNFLIDKSLKLPFCICWANHKWTTSWTAGEIKVIYSQEYKDKDEWKKHFDYLLPFFKDSRYIKKNGKPLFVIYEAIRDGINEMLDYWQVLAKESGLPGIDFAYQEASADNFPKFDSTRYTYDIEYQSMYARLRYDSNTTRKNKIIGLLQSINEKTLKLKAPYQLLDKRNNKGPIKYDYDKLWNIILDMKPISNKSIPGAFIRMDTTPRRQMRGVITLGMTHQKFKVYMKRQIIHTRDSYKKDMIFLFAWNEWAEGGYLEPDEKYKYASLEAIKAALEETNEFPEYNV